MTASDVGLFIDPASHHFEQDRLFGDEQDPTTRDDVQAPYAHVRSWFQERGIPVHTGDLIDDNAKRCRQNVYISLGMRTRWSALTDRPNVVLAAFFALECPVVEPKLYRDLADLEHHFRHLYSFSDGDSLRPFLTRPLHFHSFRIPQSYNTVHEGLWDRRGRRLLTMINGNKLPRLYARELYTERLRAIEYFSSTGEFDLYGKGWDKPSSRVGVTWVPYTVKRMTNSVTRGWQRLHPDAQLTAARRAWRGAVENKADVLSRYDFAICFENMILPGWITEKIFDCFFSGTIPVYLGAPEIADVIPTECFVDMRDFADYDELAEHLRTMPEQRRQEMRDAARSYVGSPQYHQFTKEAFRDTIGRIVEDATGTELRE